jgi:hypothetical protein
MLKWFLHRYIRGMEKRYSYDATYLHELADISTTGFRRYVRAQTAARWTANVPAGVWHCAGIAGALVEDCGPCVQIASDMAMEAGTPPETIEALLSGSPAPADAQLAFDYGRALLNASETLDDLRDQVEKRWGKDGLVALSLASMYARNFPVLKRALGHAKACQKVRIGNTDVAVNQMLKAA